MSVTRRVCLRKGGKVTKRMSRRELDILKRAEKKSSASEGEEESIEDVLDSLKSGGAFLAGGSMFTDEENEFLEKEAFRKSLEVINGMKRHG